MRSAQPFLTRTSTSPRPRIDTILHAMATERSRRSSDPPHAPLAPDPTRRRLTAREREIALLVGDGLKDAVIALRLGLTVSTTGHYVRKVLRRLRLRSRRDLVAWVAVRRASTDVGDVLRRAETNEVPKTPGTNGDMRTA
jgi:DNA-binding CsgD family transcriptional regulator